jgi:hypothetical protein
MAVIEVQLLADPFTFEASEEALDHRIVPTVSAPAHALDRAAGTQLGEKARARVLGSPDPNGTSGVVPGDDDRKPVLLPLAPSRCPRAD